MWWRPLPVLATILVILLVHGVPVIADDCGCGGDSGSGDSSDGGSASGYGSSSDPTALAAAGRDLSVSGRYQEALEAFNDSLALDPYNTQTLMGKAEVLFLLQRYPEAAGVYRKVVEINPRHDGAYFCLGNTYLVMREYQAAADAYERSLGIRPGNLPAAENLRVARSYLGERVPTVTLVAEPSPTVQQITPGASTSPPREPVTTPQTTRTAPLLHGWIGVISLAISMAVALAGERWRKGTSFHE